jgi:hypothetical protein
MLYERVVGLVLRFFDQVDLLRFLLYYTNVGVVWALGGNMSCEATVQA